MGDKKTQRLDDFMGEALSLYYGSRDPIGLDGDFITAPEISQLFGEIIGVWAVQKWNEMGSPTAFNLVEIGPGRGTLMADLLRGTEKLGDFLSSAHIHLIETSPTLKSKQQETLKEYDVTWHEHLSNVQNDIPTIIIANEFFDALPVRQFKFENNEWLEHFIVNDESAWHPANDDIPTKPTLGHPKDNDILEHSTAQEDYIHLFNQYHGAFLIIDYGYFKSAYGDSLQALHKHAPCALTDHVGEADLTTHVDFEWLAALFTNAKITFKTQANFLRDNGIDIRMHILGAQKMQSGYDRLMNSDQMGDLFKVMEVEKF